MLRCWIFLISIILICACSAAKETAVIQPSLQGVQNELPSATFTPPPITTETPLPAATQAPLPTIETVITAATRTETAVIQKHNMVLTSPLIEAGGEINPLFTCYGRGISPLLEWSGSPEGTKSYALLMEDPATPAGVYVHWLLFNIPADRTDIPQDVPRDETVLGIGVQGINDTGKIGYFGPCPSSGGPPHRYVFRLYALDTRLFLPAEAVKSDLEKAIEGHILDQAEFYATFQHEEQAVGR